MTFRLPAAAGARCPRAGVLGLCAVLASALAHADAVHKCVDRGHVTYQATPCAHDDAVLAMPAPPGASEVAAAAARAQAEKARVAAGEAPASGASAPVALGAGGVPADPLDGCPILQRDRSRLVGRQAALANPGRPELATPQARAQASAAQAEALHEQLAVEDALRQGHCGIASP